MIGANGEQPFAIYRCAKCHHISLDRWVDGTHRDPGREKNADQTEYRCDGQPRTEAYYLISQDEYLDFMWQTNDASGGGFADPI